MNLLFNAPHQPGPSLEDIKTAVEDGVKEYGQSLVHNPAFISQVRAFSAAGDAAVMSEKRLNRWPCLRVIGLETGRRRSHGSPSTHGAGAGRGAEAHEALDQCHAARPPAAGTGYGRTGGCPYMRSFQAERLTYRLSMTLGSTTTRAATRRGTSPAARCRTTPTCPRCARGTDGPSKCRCRC